MFDGFNKGRRRLIGAALFASLSPSVVGCGVLNRGATGFVGNPFSLGIGSGDPVADGFVLWTRVAPDPFDVRQLAREDVLVNWEIAEDSRFSTIVRTGQVLAHPEHAHSVHIHLSGLKPGREYFYRFHCAGATSPVGRALTCPNIGIPLDSLRFAVCCCQSYTDGFYAAYRDVAAQVPDLVIHVGDYIYERPIITGIRSMPTPEATSLDDYRKCHAATKTDPHLQAAHAIAPWLAIWDDHEVFDDYRGLHVPVGQTTEAFRSRRAAAYKAYYEHMPLRLDREADGTHMRLYRRAGFGNLAQFDLLDTRQYRSDHPCRSSDGATPSWISCSSDDPARTMLGSSCP